MEERGGDGPLVGTLAVERAVQRDLAAQRQRHVNGVEARRRQAVLQPSRPQPPLARLPVDLGASACVEEKVALNEQLAVARGLDPAGKRAVGRAARERVGGAKHPLLRDGTAARSLLPDGKRAEGRAAVEGVDGLAEATDLLFILCNLALVELLLAGQVPQIGC